MPAKSVLFNTSDRYMPSNVTFMANDTRIELVSEVVYLGYVFTYNNSDNHYVETLYRGLCIR